MHGTNIEEGGCRGLCRLGSCGFTLERHPRIGWLLWTAVKSGRPVVNRKGDSLFECPCAMCYEHKTNPACALVRFYFLPTVETLGSPYWCPAMMTGGDRVTRDMIMHEQPSDLAAAVHVQAWTDPSSRSSNALSCRSRGAAPDRPTSARFEPLRAKHQSPSSRHHFQAHHRANAPPRAGGLRPSARDPGRAGACVGVAGAISASTV